MLPTLDSICEAALRLPCSPVLLPRLVSTLADENAGIDELEAVVRLDPSLAGATLRLANSVVFSGGRSADTLSEALLRLGQREVYRLAALAMAGRWMSAEARGFRWEPGDFFRLSLVTAVAAEALAESTGRVNPQLAYTAGLIQDIGKLALAHSCADHFGEIRATQARSGCTWLDAEKTVLGLNHAEVGAELLRRWKFPPSLVAVVVHNPPGPSVPEADMPLVVHVHAARYVAVSMGPGVGEEGFLFHLNSGLLTEWGFSSEVLESAFPTVVERAGRLLHDQMNTGTMAFD